MRRVRWITLIAAGYGSCTWAGGFQLFEQSARAVGSGFSNQVSADDPTTAFWNPAGMTRLTGTRFALVGGVIKPTGKFSDAGSRTFLPPPGGLPLPGGDGGDPGAYTALGGAFLVASISHHARFGVAIAAPFGLSTSYDAGWKGRYYALDSDLRTIAVNPSVAYQVARGVSIGAGVSAVFAKAKLSNAIDFSTVCLAQAAQVPSFAPACSAGGLTVPGNPATDGEVRLEASDWGFGWNVGVMLAPADPIRFGVTYRSKVTHELEGDASFLKPSVLPTPLASAPAFQDGGIKAHLELPETVAASGHHDLNERWQVTGSLSWTRWSRLKEVRIRFDNGAPDAVTPFNWKDAWRLAVGASYRVSDAFSIRGGVAYDETPVAAEFRNPRIPDATKTILGVGASYRVSQEGEIDIGYAHFFVRDAQISLQSPAAGTLVGEFNRPKIDVLLIQYSGRF